jgi:opacity protein-like surface antigen
MPMAGVIRSALVIAALVGAATSASAQAAGDGYLFHAPDLTLSVRAGYSHANAASDVFDDVTTNLTLDRGDFSGLALGADVALHATERVDVVLSAGYSRSKHDSEFRKYVDNDDQPIEQTTTFDRMPITVGLRVNLASPGRSIGQLAWIPNRVVPYVGAGIGGVRYRFKQEGDFIDLTTFDVLENITVLTQDWALAVQGMAGVDYSISPQLGISLDARYLKARGDPGASLKGFDQIDLSGLTATIGLSIRM